MLSTPLLVPALAPFSVGALSGFTGFGHAAIVVPLLLLAYDTTTVVVLAGVLSASVAADVVRDSWREADRGMAPALLAAALPALAAGARTCVYGRVGEGACWLQRTLNDFEGRLQKRLELPSELPHIL